MLATPACYTRECRHFIGSKNDGDETTERVYCSAFPDQIPGEIAYGDNLHSVPLEGQENEIVFESSAERS